jgi:hypothetical protein
MGQRKARRSQGFVMRQDLTVWINMGPYPCDVGFCPSETAWRKIVRQYRLPERPYLADVSEDKRGGGCCEHIRSPDGDFVYVVCINEQRDALYRTDPSQAVGTLVHETLHVWQAICKELLSEEQPHAAHELEAYAVTHIFRQLFDAYLNTRIRRKR